MKLENKNFVKHCTCRPQASKIYSAQKDTKGLIKV